jgi:hypothetical protein
MFVIRKRLGTLKHYPVIKKISFSPTMLLFALVSSLLLFASLNPMYSSYAQTIDQTQGVQPTDQGRPLSNTGGNFTTPLGTNETGGNFTTPLGTNETGGEFGGAAPNELSNFTSPTENATGGGGGAETPPGGGGGAETPPGGGGGAETPPGGGELGPSNQSLANQTSPGMNETIPPPKPVIFTKNLSNNSGTSTEQKVATSGSNVYVAWEDTSQGGNTDILFTKSGNNGATFGNLTTNLSNNTGESTNPQITAFRNNVYVAWEDTSQGGNTDILFTKSTDNGATFGNVTNLSNNTGESTNPQIFASGSNVYVAWEDSTLKKSDILFTKSGNNGATFGNLTTNLSNKTGESTNPQIFASGSNVYVAWEDTSQGGNTDILFTKSGNNGATFGNLTTNLSNNNGESKNPQIAAFRNNVYVAWEDYPLVNSINNQILFARSIDNGMKFENTIRLSNNTGESTNPQIAAFRNNVYVAWEDTSPDGTSDILYTRSPNNGATFGNLIKVNAIAGQPLPGQPLNPQIFASGSNVYVSWTNHNATTGNDVVLFARSSNNGILFSDIRGLSNPGGESVLPQIATSRNNVYVIWSYDDTAKASDKTNSTLGSSDVLFLRGPNGNFPGSSLLGSPSSQFGAGANISTAAAPSEGGLGGAGGGSEFGQAGGGAGGTPSSPSGGGLGGAGGGSEFGQAGGGAGGAPSSSSGGGFGGGT